MLAHTAVTLLIGNNQSLKRVCVTGDSKYSFCKSLVYRLPLLAHKNSLEDCRFNIERIF